MRRIVRGLPGVQVTSGVTAIRRLNAERVIPADVALGASGHFSGRRQLVGVGEREAGGTVIKFAVCPDRDGMACRASRRAGRKIRGDVVRDIPADRLRAVPG